MALTDFLTNLFKKKDDEENKYVPTSYQKPSDLRSSRQIFQASDFDKSRNVLSDYQKEQNQSSSFTSDLIQKAKPFIPFTKEWKEKESNVIGNKTVKPFLETMAKPATTLGTEIGNRAADIKNIPMLNKEADELNRTRESLRAKAYEKRYQGDTETFNRIMKLVNEDNPAEKTIKEREQRNKGSNARVAASSGGLALQMASLMVPKGTANVAATQAKNLFTGAGVSGGMSAGLTALFGGTKEDIVNSFVTGAGDAPKNMGVGVFTNPIFDPIIKTAAKTPAGAVIGRSIAGALTNLFEDQATSRLIDLQKPELLDNAISLALGAIFGNLGADTDKVVRTTVRNAIDDYKKMSPMERQKGSVDLDLLSKKKTIIDERQFDPVSSSNLRPLNTTSIGETLAPSSASATKLEPSLKTDTLSPSYKYSPETSADAIMKDPGFINKYNEALSEKPYLSNIITEIAGNRNHIIGEKAIETAAGKIARKLPGKPYYSENDIGDLIRGNIVARDDADAINILNQLKGKTNVQEIEDYITNATEWGYQGININILTPKGVKAEVQIHTPQSIAIQEKLHPIYEKWRNEKSVPAEVFEQSRRIAEDIKVEFKKKAQDKKLDFIEGIDDSVIKNPPSNIKDILNARYNSVEGLPLTNKQADANKTRSTGKDIPLTNKPSGDQTSSNKYPTPPKPKGMEERSFIETVRESPTSKEELATGVKGFYKPITNKETLTKAFQRIKADPNKSLEEALTPGGVNADKTALQLALMHKYQKEGNFKNAIDIAEFSASEATTQGQAIQALSMWGRLTPEGALKYAQRTIKKVNADLPPKKQIKLGEDQAKKITKMAEDIQDSPQGSRERVVKTAQLMDEIAAIVPEGLASKLGTLQTIAQLLNPKTAIRNIGGNLGFSAIENVKDVVAAPLDLITSAVTGKRTKTLPSLTTQAKGFKQGLKLGLEDAIKGIDTSGRQGTQFDLNRQKVFKTGILGKAEKVLDITLQVPDRAFYQSAYDESLRQQMKAAKVKEATPEMEAQANYDGLYRTFQDDNIASKLFSGLKKSLNYIGVKDKNNKRFGLGDLIIKYPKTPGALLARSIEYSPAGFMQSVLEIGKPFVLGKEFNQKAFVESLSRATTGTVGLVATGAILHQLGIVTGEPTDDYDINRALREQGLGDYRFNVSAMKRFVLSGFDAEAAKTQSGDKIMSYDWFQPQAINIAMGADIDANKGTTSGFIGRMAAALSSASNTIVNQPMVQGLEDLFYFGDLPKGIQKTLTNLPSSFVPTFLNQIKQLTDNSSRNSNDPDMFKQSMNQVKYKLPGLSKTLPERIDTKGNIQQMFQDGGNNLFNVFINPAFTSKKKDDVVLDEVMNIYKRSGETRQAPRVVANSLSISKDGKTENIKLTAQQQKEMQQYFGNTSNKILTKFVSDPKFMALPDDRKAEVMSNVMSDVMTATKVIYAGHRPETLSKKIRGLLSQYKVENMGDLPMTNRSVNR